MQKKNGISLIVLVITIIVMIVLAGAIILSLNNAGIIGKSNQAVKDTDKATVKELAQMAWGEAYAAGVRKVEGENGLEAKVKEALRNNGLEVNDYGILVTTKGVEIVKGWIQDKTIIKRGDKELTVGQTVKYKATGTDYAGEWKLLGADEDGNILIMSASDVKDNHIMGFETTDTTAEARLKECQNDWLNGATELDNVCTVYGRGTYAIGARSIRVEDIDKIVDYDKTAYEKGNIYAYGNKVTYKYNGTTKLKYEGTNSVEGALTAEHTNGFYWYDEKGFHNITAADLTNETNNGKEIVTIISSYYGYEGISTGKLTSDTDAYKMLFGIEGNYNEYWLSSPLVHTYTNCVGYGMYRVYEGDVTGNTLWNSAGSKGTYSKSVRAVVTLQYNIPMSSLV